MTNAAGFPFLSIILFLPLLGAAVLMFVPKENSSAIRLIANLFALAGFLVSVPLWFWYNVQDAGYQFVERMPWIPSVGAQYFLGVDGFSALLVLLATLFGSIAILSSWTAITERVKEYYIFLLILQTGMVGAFVSLDFLLFFLFWEVMLVPMYFLIGIWGSDRRLYSAIKFFLYTLVGSVIMLLGILALYFYSYSVTGVYTFDITQFQNMNVPFNLQWWVFLAFFLGFAVKVPMFPFHTWLPDAHTDAPTAGSVILAAVLLKMGTYGFIRFSLPILPDATRHFVPMMVTLSIIGIVYGALCAMAQQDWKRLVAYSSVSHMAMVMLGMFALNPVGIMGSIVQQLNHGISTGALFLLVGNVYERRHTRQISEYGGLSKVMPTYAVIFLIMTMSSIGLPALNGFIGELLILQGVFVANKIWAGFAASGVVLGAAYMLWLYQRTMFGKIENPKNEHLQDLNFREFATYAPLLILAVWIGLYPKPFIDRLQTSVDRVVVRINPEYRAQVPVPVPGSAFASRANQNRNWERGTRNPREPASACRHQPERFLLPAAGDRSHHGRAAPAACGSDDSARQAVAPRVGDARGARRDSCGPSAGGRRQPPGLARAHRGRSVCALLQGDLPRVGGLYGPDERQVPRGRRHPRGRVLLPDSVRDPRHDVHGRRDRSDHALHRSRDDGDFVLHPDGIPEAEPAIERSGREILPAGRVFARHPALRHVAHVRPLRHDEPACHCDAACGAGVRPPADPRRHSGGRRHGLQDCRRAVSHVGAGRL